MSHFLKLNALLTFHITSPGQLAISPYILPPSLLVCQRSRLASVNCKCLFTHFITALPHLRLQAFIRQV